MGWRASGNPRDEPGADRAPASTRDGREVVGEGRAEDGAENRAVARREDHQGASGCGADCVIALSGVTRRFGELLAVDDVTLSVDTGTILGLIGPSGSGKTTTIRTMTGSLAPTAGTVRVLGEDPTRFRASTRERIGYMPQHFVLYPDLTAAENVDFVAALFGLLYPRRRRRVREVLQLVELWDTRGRRASRLSGGMQRRLELACAMVHEPDLLLLDEPTAGIDPILRQALWGELHRLRDDGRTLLVTTQYVGEAEHCDQVALIGAGRLVALGTPEDLRRQALGGDLLWVETEEAVDPRTLPAVEGVESVRQHGPRELMLVTVDAGETSPRVVDAFSRRGITVTTTREERPSFDEIFARLLEQQTPAGQPPEEAATEARSRDAAA
jgi:ABC-2 type transport system ATP-binding protein